MWFVAGTARSVNLKSQTGVGILDMTPLSDSLEY